MKRCWSVTVEHGNTTLSDDGASIVLRIDQVNRQTRLRVAGGKDGFVPVNAVLALVATLRQSPRDPHELGDEDGDEQGHEKPLLTW